MTLALEYLTVVVMIICIKVSRDHDHEASFANCNSGQFAIYNHVDMLVAIMKQDIIAQQTSTLFSLWDFDPNRLAIILQDFNLYVIVQDLVNHDLQVSTLTITSHCRKSSTYGLSLAFVDPRDSILNECQIVICACADP
jgi:hypothetical protein